jgi:hypothetical protein
MMTEMTWAQFSAWRAYMSVEPFGELRADLRTGQIAAMLGNIHRDTKHKTKPFSAMDFVIEFGAPTDDKPKAALGVAEPITDKATFGSLKSMMIANAKSDETAVANRAERQRAAEIRSATRREAALARRAARAGSTKGTEN